MKMSLQLYKAGDHNYLLDFQNLPVRREDSIRPLGPYSQKPSYVFVCVCWGVGDALLTVLYLFMISDSDQSDNPASHVMEFFELCATLITELGR